MVALLTHSRQDTFKVCRRKHYYAYELGLRRTEEARALRMGSAFHEGIAALGNGLGIDKACEFVRSHYEEMPEAFDVYEWVIECETILRLVCAYQWRWASAGLTNVATELAFELPCVNPATGKPTPIFNLAGKIDAIVRLEDGRLAVKETKTLSDEIGPDSPLWRRLRMDHQISLYIHAARQLGFAVDTVLYDVVRKPSIAPTAVPILDADGIKIVLDRNGNRVMNKNKTPRQTASAEDGYVLQSRTMTPEEWGQKLTDDICSRPDFYFARVEIPRLDADVAEYQAELWEIQQAIREAQRTGRHYRTVGKNTCGYCSYFDLCSTSQNVDPNNPPIGFEILSDVNPELERKADDHNNSPASSTEAAPAVEAVA